MVWHGSIFFSRCNNDMNSWIKKCSVFDSNNGEIAEFVLLDLLSCLLTTWTKML
jgi:hypothetical protein